MSAVRAFAEAVPLARQIPNPCALCPRALTRPLFHVDGALIVRCAGCGLVRQDTRPIAVAATYGAAYYTTDDPKGGYSNYVLDAETNRRTFRRRLRAIEGRLGRRGRLLDIGAALGDLVLEATAAGWDAVGVELSAYAASRARERGARVRTGTIEEAAYRDAAFDVVTVHDSLEHLTDPIGTLREVRRVLRPGGLVHLVTPNVGGLQARLFGRRWYHYKPGEHLFYFAPETLRRSVERAGLRWEGWSRSSSYLSAAYVFDRLRYYAPRPSAAIARLCRRLGLDRHAIALDVGEMQAWARRETSS